ncbi:hypothetical protein SISNIDRAFT_452165 [Sistotremastrum niveocremeum HHB9708]|uniref:Gylcosyl hydrolase 115 C-terminal domain-containing protein n=1 Tax=Sistotremastrum niveocremeum HHB9708 TaxID=1314777 RepID=A0A164WZQ5_9AGAM|nr:hypothetical protein SISNIDRAFT_452165 [Sistotremastrum niveocremeum HHB9708]
MWGTHVSLASVLWLLLSRQVHALNAVNCATSSTKAFSVVSSGKAAPIWIGSDDWPGVQRAASDFQSDIQKVTGVKPSLTNFTSNAKVSGIPIIVGTLGRSSLISQVVKNAKIDVSSINGTWESFWASEVSNPLPGVKQAYVIIGADKRGSIFGLYTHSESFGVSPWYWWADVPVKTSKSLFASGCQHGTPTVKYRGFFLNDEQPALQNWAQEKFNTNWTATPFNHFFYSNNTHSIPQIFELMLRLKGNYLWPAQWSSSFGVDDPENQFLADWYGVVMGTSHEEPMARSIPNEWNEFGSGPWDFSVNADNITEFWKVGVERAKPYETLYTVGMRGNGDEPLSTGESIGLLENVISVQRGLLSDAFPNTNVSKIPQVWCLYKEVQGYYQDGMTVPDDITLLWTDDNWGNIRRYPLQNETSRSGGAGVYYHVDYVGTPRDYKWIQSSQIPKHYEQLSLAVTRNATQVWILNVGDLKPYERDTEFFITYGYNASIYNQANLDTAYVIPWAQREFGLSASKTAQVAEIIGNFTRYNSRRKPELWNSTTYSLTNYNEADTVLAEWQAVAAASDAIYNSLDKNTQPAFFQLVQHPVQASANLANMYIQAGFNQLRASQARLSANSLAVTVENLFEHDFDFESEYHSLLDGKWDHIMDQTHAGYYYWQQPMTNTMPSVSRVQSKKQALPGPMRIGLDGSAGAWPGDNPNDCAQQYSCPNPYLLTLDNYTPSGSRYIDIAAGGPNTFQWTINSNVTWLKLNSTKGTVTASSPETRIKLTVDWSKVTGAQYAAIQINATAKGQAPMNQPVFFIANNTVVPKGFKGFVEGDGGISIEAAHATRNTAVNGVQWTELPGYGRTISGVTPYPPTGNNDQNFTVGAGPLLEYDFYNFNTLVNGTLNVTTYVSPSFNGYGDDRRLAFAISIDDASPAPQYFMPLTPATTTPAGWDTPDGFVANSIVSVNTQHTNITTGNHTLKIYAIEPAVVVQKIVINTGNVRYAYLGPPESIRV